jgi:hypothetical protein
MVDKILYYPTINLPNNEWTTKSILYWDEIGVIVPDEFVERPEQLDKFMQDYVQSGLVTQHLTGYYGQQQYDASKAVLKLISSEVFHLQKSIDGFIEGSYRRIHKGKFTDELFEKLIALSIAMRPSNSIWYLIEERIADIMMSYLAASIGRAIQHQPSTDEPKFIDEADHLGLVDNDRSKLRVQLLENVMPYPFFASPAQILNFKEKYNDELKDFRRTIEKKIWTISSIPEEEARKKVIEIEIEELNAKKEHLVAKLNEGKLGKVVLGAVKGLVVDGAITLVSGDVIKPIGTVLGGLNEIIKSYKGNPLKNEDLAFVALMEKRL